MNQMIIAPDGRTLASVPAEKRIATEHLLLRLGPVNRGLRLLAESRSGENARQMRPDGHQRSISEQHAQWLFASVDALASPFARPVVDLTLSPQEERRQDQLRKIATAGGWALPLDALVAQLGLSAFEATAVLVGAAAELSPNYQRINAYVHDDLNRLAPSSELVGRLACSDFVEEVVHRADLAEHGTLVRRGILHCGPAPADGMNQDYRLGDAVLGDLTNPEVGWLSAYPDQDLVDTSRAFPLELFPDAERLGAVAAWLKGRPAAAIGLWGKPYCGGAEVAASLAAAAGLMLRRLASRADASATARCLRVASALNAIVWLDIDSHSDPDALADSIARHPGPLILTGTQPWRPLRLMSARPFLDVSLAPPDRNARAQQWRAAAPGRTDEVYPGLADRYQFSPAAMHAAVKTASLEHSLGKSSNGGDGDLLSACRSVSLSRASEFATTVFPRRHPDDLILPPALHRRVTEVAAFNRELAKVDEQWGFGRFGSGGGIKVLMTGDSGTGKTAAAEVIAGMVDREQPMLKVHLASVVSKWVGETEKNLEAVFQHAEESHAVLFFDEADSLFAKRGEVERGADRYANLEVGFLLQRLEDFAGLAILASNHKDQIDEAFMRRFQVVLHFPRPNAEDRLRLWQMALPSQAPLGEGIDLDLLKSLDLTGAGIVNASRTAALLAARDNADIDMTYLVPAVVRQFHHEARLLPLSHLGRYAALAGAM